MKTLLIHIPDDVYDLLKLKTEECLMVGKDLTPVHDFAIGVVAAIEAGASEKTFAIFRFAGGTDESQ